MPVFYSRGSCGKEVLALMDRLATTMWTLLEKLK